MVDVAAQHGAHFFAKKLHDGGIGEGGNGANASALRELSGMDYRIPAVGDVQR